MKNPHLPRSQSGVALAVALFLLIIITLLGVTSLRASQLALKLSANDQSRLDANQSAQALSEAYLRDLGQFFPVGPEVDVALSCLPTGLVANTPSAALPFSAPFSCATANLVEPVTHSDKFTGNSYVQIFRESVSGNALASANAVATGGTSYRVQYARFRIVSGYDRSDEGLGAAEVTQGVYVAVPSVAGMNLF